MERSSSNKCFKVQSFLGIFALFLTHLASLGGPTYAGTAHILTATVQRVSDGDTLTAITANQTKLRIHLLGIDALEIPHGQKPGQPYGEEAATAWTTYLAARRFGGMCGPQLVAH